MVTDNSGRTGRLSLQISDEEFALLRAGNHRYADNGKIFHMAIIDYLQEYNCLKRCERFCVPIWSKGEKESISVAKPHFYGTRFQSFLERTFFSQWLKYRIP